MRAFLQSRRGRTAYALLAMLAGTRSLCAQTDSDASQAENWAVHGQLTFVEQFHPSFTSPYRGPNSLDPGNRGDETVAADLFTGARPWDGAEIWADSEVFQGFGFNNTLGLAGFSSGRTSISVVMRRRTKRARCSSLTPERRIT
jgi:high affinity Mn2+ porin